GLAHLVWESALRTPDAAAALAGPRPEALTPAQARAVADIVAAVQRGRGEAVVLFGVTGSGKTEVYLRAIAECLAAGGGAIVLVPEIALTPQMVARFVDRFGSRVAVLHSGLSAGEKRDEWSRIRRGEARIVVGARSAVFAPVQGLKLIIVDEEHEPSYKQEETPHYDARDVARWRAQYRGGVVVYGSATPSLEAMHEVEQGRARLLTLPTRVHGGPLPPVQIVDMREELRSGNRSIFSRALADGLERTVTAGHQAMLFLNRRGYAAFVLCRNCGAILQCPHCDISLTVHKGAAGEGALVCHYCGFAAALPDACPDCGEAVLRPFGIGTQQVEEAIRARWPLWRVARMDVDTTRRKGAHREVLEAFYRNELDVLVGTQMIAKGLDVPNVAFVGVVMADTMLAVPDFRAAERTFDLLTQVVGRAGRAEVPGETVIQTFQPDHYAILAAARHDYAAFYRQERALRERFFYPPFCELAVFVAVHADPGIARGAAARFERELRRRLGPQHEVLPAVPAAVPRVQNRFRYQVVIKYRRWPDVQAAVTAAYTLVEARLRRYGGACRLDVNAGRI
ncbi:replication restart helicase PriA, partial [Alicyclobacillus cellulosilyticus]|uniref:replication restart helicase PriA n=1 Tax=Alicyclobacillus cellulosilyticus TaxID=1003997 RepID=UPI00166B5D96